MDIHVIRHGIAEEKSFDGTDDARALTSEGIEKTRRAARGLARLIDVPDVVLTSPKVRAGQTAQLVARAFDLQPVTIDALANDDVLKLVEMLSDRREESIAIVGHEPTLSRLIHMLCTGSDGQPFLELKKASVASVRIARKKRSLTLPGSLRFLATAKMLARIGS